MLTWIRKRWFRRAPLSHIEHARRLIDAIDRGGIPLNAAKVNAIARSFGLDVSRRAPVDETVERMKRLIAEEKEAHDRQSFLNTMPSRKRIPSI